MLKFTEFVLAKEETSQVKYAPSPPKKIKKPHKNESIYQRSETKAAIYLKKYWSTAHLFEKTGPDPILLYFPLNFASFDKDTRMQKFKVNL